MEFKVTREPDWPHDAACPRYSFSYIGGATNQIVLAAALTPRTKTGQADLRARLVLHQLLFRLRTSNIRRRHKHLPEFGPYRFSWFKLEEMASWAALSLDQTKRGMEHLVHGRIVYSTRACRSEPLSYRLTDEAFQMAHVLQYLPLRAKVALDLRASEMSKEECQKVSEQVAEYLEDYPRRFAEIVLKLEPTFDEWHKSKHASGRRLTPTEFGLTAEMEKAFADEFPALT